MLTAAKLNTVTVSGQAESLVVAKGTGKPMEVRRQKSAWRAPPPTEPGKRLYSVVLPNFLFTGWWAIPRRESPLEGTGEGRASTHGEPEAIRYPAHPVSRYLAVLQESRRCDFLWPCVAERTLNMARLFILQPPSGRPKKWTCRRTLPTGSRLRRKRDTFLKTYWRSSLPVMG